jgi:hypothetical protein
LLSDQITKERIIELLQNSNSKISFFFLQKCSSCTRSQLTKHYILLEQWQKEHTEKLAVAPNDKKKQNVAGSLTEDSCFWMNVEEALISCKQLKDGSNVEKQSARERLNMFEQYVMDQINNYAVSPDIFLEKSSFMNWWKDFQEIIETSHDSPLRGFMKNCRRQYEKGQF